MSFPTPIAIAANTTYVISYLAPNGHYPGQDTYFATAGVDNAPLHALRNGVDGPNGLYKYSTTSVFPTDTYQSEGYFVDVVFNTTNGPDVTAPTVKSVNPFAGASGVLTTTNALVTFMEAMDPATIIAANVFLRTPTSTVVPATLSYTAATNTATIVPTSSLAYSTTYTGVVKAAVKDLAGNAMAADFTWTFTTSAPPPPPPTQGPGGPVLVVTSTANPFSTYYAEILRGEGLNAFATADLSTVTSTVLNGYDAVILGEGTLTSAQVTMFTNWVNAGGNLIAMRPDKQLASLLGLTDASADAVERLHAGQHRVGAWRGHRQPDDAVPRTGRSLHAERRDLDRDPLFERDDRDRQSRGDDAERGQRQGDGVHLRPGEVGHLHAAGQPGVVGHRSATASRRSAPTISSSVRRPATFSPTGSTSTRSRFRRPTSSSGCCGTCC